MVLFVLQCCLPGIVIFGCLSITGLDQPTGNPAFDRIFSTMDGSSALLLLGLTASFVCLVYFFMAVGSRFAQHLRTGGQVNQWIVLRASLVRLLIILACGLILTLISFWRIGDNLVDRYAALIAFRADSDQVRGGTLIQLAYLLTQTWLWISVIALFVFFERRGRTIGWYLCLTSAVIFAVLAVQRRAIFIPVLLAYLALVLFDGRWRLKFVLAISVPILLVVAFGKEVLAALAFGGSIQDVSGRYQSVAAAALRTASEVGITVVESLGTINLLHLPPRFGVDHLLSVMRGVPLGPIVHWTGQDSGMPTRIVRISTEAFATANDEDIPPGLFGQMWLDFRIVGPVIWALGFAVQLSLAQWVFSSAVRTRVTTAAIVLFTFVIALPLNTGSYDFSCGYDIVVLAFCLIFAFKACRITLRAEDVGMASSGD